MEQSRNVSYKILIQLVRAKKSFVGTILGNFIYEKWINIFAKCCLPFFSIKTKSKIEILINIFHDYCTIIYEIGE